jgi:diguanylate cyclase (GGDEF)-like protein
VAGFDINTWFFALALGLVVFAIGLLVGEHRRASAGERRPDRGALRREAAEDGDAPSAPSRAARSPAAEHASESASAAPLATPPLLVLAVEAQAPHRIREAAAPGQAQREQTLASALVGKRLHEVLQIDDAARRLRERTTDAVDIVGGGEARLVESLAGGSERRYLSHWSGDPDRDAVLHAMLVDVAWLERAGWQPAERSSHLQQALDRMRSGQRFMQGLQHITELLQTCDSEAHAGTTLAQGGPELFPGWDGALTFPDALGTMTVVGRWGEFPDPPPSREDECWSIRLRRLHQLSAQRDAQSPPVCGHLGGGRALPDGIAHTICVPLLSIPDRPGALHLISRTARDEAELRAASWGAEALAGALRLALANLHLRTSLRDQAVRDWMTGLFNRRHFDETMRHEISRAERTRDRLTLALLDIDHFKSFNDTYGHEAGDEVIKAVAEQLKHFGRSYDIACRVGGEELAVLMPRAGLSETCVRLEWLRERIAATKVQHKGIELPSVTVSIGVAGIEQESADDLMHRADVALYAAKHGGRNRVSCWTPEMEAGSLFGNFDDAQRVLSGKAASAARGSPADSEAR